MRLTEQKGDVYRTSVAEDPAGQVHVAWSERQGEEWDLYERVWDGTNWGARRQIATGHGPNFYHKLVGGAGGPLRLFVEIARPHRIASSGLLSHGTLSSAGSGAMTSSAGRFSAAR